MKGGKISKMKGINKLYEKFKARCQKANYNINEVLSSNEIDKMLLISLVKPRMVKK